MRTFLRRCAAALADVALDPTTAAILLLVALALMGLGVDLPPE